MTEQFFNLREAAAYAHVARTTINYWLKCGYLKGVRRSTAQGRPWIIPKSSLDKHMELNMRYHPVVAMESIDTPEVVDRKAVINIVKQLEKVVNDAEKILENFKALL